jgi:hypothetical protein
LRQHYWEFRGLGIDFVAAANDTPETNRDLRERLDLPFSILSDEDAGVSAAYGAFHENEPQGRSISRVSMFLIRAAADGGTIGWEYVGPTSRHRLAPSRLIEEIQTFMGVNHQVTSVVVPSAWHIDRMIESFQDPPLGLYRTPDQVQPGVMVYRDYTRELAMQAHGEIHRLADEGWRLVSVSPEMEGAAAIGQRYVFERSVARDEAKTTG